MQTYAVQHGLTPFISMQNYYSAAYREGEPSVTGPLPQRIGVLTPFPDPCALQKSAR